MKFDLGKYSKLVVAVLGAANAVVQAYAGTAWAPAVTAVLTAIAVYVVPNSPAQPAATK